MEKQGCEMGKKKKKEKEKGFIEAYGSMWDYAVAFECLLERLEMWRDIADLFAHPVHFANNINRAREKLDEYYRKLSDSPAYYAAVALHPAYRWQFFNETWEEKPQWIHDAKASVQKVWDDEYDQTNRESQAAEPTHKKRGFESMFGQYGGKPPLKGTLNLAVRARECGIIFILWTN